MSEVGIRALKQNASAVVARAAAGEVITVTDRGRPVAQLTPLPQDLDPIERLIATGRATPATGRLEDLPEPLDGPPLTPILLAMREEERY